MIQESASQFVVLGASSSTHAHEKRAAVSFKKYY
jgi:hypothetical protein